MKYALVDGQRREAQPGLSGECRSCGSTMVARCGEVRVWHWAHTGRRHCDPWWENETEWHRAWKGQFPVEWQEIVHHADDGERHIADVKTEDDWVLEFQHSYIKPDERRSRENFYPKLVWVIDGLRRKTDLAGFQKALNLGTQMVMNFPGVKVPSDKGALLRDWTGCRAHVFFDFGDIRTIWWLAPSSDRQWAHVVRIGRTEFVATHLRMRTKEFSDFDSFAECLIGLVADNESHHDGPAARGKARILLSMSGIRPQRRIQRGRGRRL